MILAALLTVAIATYILATVFQMSKEDTLLTGGFLLVIGLLIWLAGTVAGQTYDACLEADGAYNWLFNSCRTPSEVIEIDLSS